MLLYAAELTLCDKLSYSSSTNNVVSKTGEIFYTHAARLYTVRSAVYTAAI